MSLYLLDALLTASTPFNEGKGWQSWCQNIKLKVYGKGTTFCTFGSTVATHTLGFHQAKGNMWLMESCQLEGGRFHGRGYIIAWCGPAMQCITWYSFKRENHGDGYWWQLKPQKSSSSCASMVAHNHDDGSR